MFLRKSDAGRSLKFAGWDGKEYDAYLTGVGGNVARIEYRVSTGGRYLPIVAYINRKDWSRLSAVQAGA